MIDNEIIQKIFELNLAFKKQNGAILEIVLDRKATLYLRHLEIAIKNSTQGLPVIEPTQSGAKSIFGIIFREGNG